MVIRTLILFYFLFSGLATFGQVGIGTNSPDPSAQLDIVSPNKGFLPPRVTSTSQVTGTPAKGLVVYQTSGSEGLYVYDGLEWQKLIPTSTFAHSSAANFGLFFGEAFQSFQGFHNWGFTQPNSYTFSPDSYGTYLLSYKFFVVSGSDFKVDVIFNGVSITNIPQFGDVKGSMQSIEKVLDVNAGGNIQIRYTSNVTQLEIGYASLTMIRLR